MVIVLVDMLKLLKKQETILKNRGGSLTKLSETYKPFYYPWVVDLTVRHEKVTLD